MDPDDMYMNENLFQDLYNINIEQNLDIKFNIMWMRNDISHKI